MQNINLDIIRKKPSIDNEGRYVFKDNVGNIVFTTTKERFENMKQGFKESSEYYTEAYNLISKWL